MVLKIYFINFGNMLFDLSGFVLFCEFGKQVMIFVLGFLIIGGIYLVFVDMGLCNVEQYVVFGLLYEVMFEMMIEYYFVQYGLKMSDICYIVYMYVYIDYVGMIDWFLMMIIVGILCCEFEFVVLGIMGLLMYIVVDIKYLIDCLYMCGVICLFDVDGMFEEEVILGVVICFFGVYMLGFLLVFVEIDEGIVNISGDIVYNLKD